MIAMKHFPNLSQRANTPELMDNPQCDTRLLYQTLSTLSIINRIIAKTSAIFKKHLAPHILNSKHTTIVDVGCGGGDFICWLAGWAKQNHCSLSILGIDSDPRVVAFAQKKCSHLPNVTIKKHCGSEIDTIDSPIDFIHCNHLLHHLSDEQVLFFLDKAQSIARRGVLCNDIYRCYRAYYWYIPFVAMIPRKGFAFTDGLLSITKSFTTKDMKNLLSQKKSLSSFRVTRDIFFRIIVHNLPEIR